MESGCEAQNLDTTPYSSPIPVIGLYIAAGSLVCFLLMLFDIISAYRRTQSWIPCRFFTLNSFTLTLLAIATKLQVDLTTPMPGVPDQLSKLTGTTFLCICMGFLNLSVGNNGDSEYLPNMASSSIMIITVVVNICIQLYTGVIHMFIPEHIIMMFCMLVVLILMWFCARETKLRNAFDIELVRGSLTRDNSNFKNVSLSRRLKTSYAMCFDKNTQLRACRHKGNLILVPFCLVCCCVLVEAIVRSVVLKQLRFCRGTSDYRRSTWFILVIQNLTVFLGCSALCFRWFTSFSFMHLGSEFYVERAYNDYLMEKKFISIFGFSSGYKFGIYLQTSLYHVVEFLWFLLLFPLVKLFHYFGGELHEEKYSSSVEEFKRQIMRSDEILYMDYTCNWTMEKVMNDFDKCVEESRRGSPKELLILLSRISPSPQRCDLSSLFQLATLVKTAITCLPEASTKTLVLCLHETIDILQAVLYPKDPEFAIVMTTKVMVDEHFDERFRSSVGEYSQISHQARFPPDVQWYERHDIDRQRRENYLHRLCSLRKWRKYEKVVKEIQNRWRDTREDLYGVIEQLFVDMLHSAFAEIPNAVSKLVTECPMDEYKERVRPALVALLKCSPLEDYVKWSFPDISGISSLKPLEAYAADDQNNQTDGDNDANTSPPPKEDNVVGVDISSSSTHDTLEIEEL